MGNTKVFKNPAAINSTKDFVGEGVYLPGSQYVGKITTGAGTLQFKVPIPSNTNVEAVELNIMVAGFTTYDVGNSFNLKVGKYGDDDYFITAQTMVHTDVVVGTTYKVLNKLVVLNAIKLAGEDCLWLTFGVAAGAPNIEGLIYVTLKHSWWQTD